MMVLIIGTGKTLAAEILAYEVSCGWVVVLLVAGMVVLTQRSLDALPICPFSLASQFARSTSLVSQRL